ncbi:MAG TPA: hypothetical protein PKA31_02525 [Candidatus Moranbacteria bacterium]|nr:hypothetical protein [Candidatus Moranbacteria bacterium]
MSLKNNPKLKELNADFDAKFDAGFAASEERMRDEEDVRKNMAKLRQERLDEAGKRFEALGHGEEGGKAVKRHPEIDREFPEEIKTEQRREDSKEKHAEHRYEEKVVKDLDKLRQELENERKTYAQIEYDNRALWTSVRKFFRRDVAEDHKVDHGRRYYENKLAEYKKAWLEDFKERLANKEVEGEAIKEEVRQLALFFDYEEPLKLYDARMEIKAQRLLGRNLDEGTEAGKKRNMAGYLGGKVWGGFEQISRQYNKLPFWGKAGLSLGVFASGAASVMMAKRVLSGIIAGVGTAQILDTAGVALDKRKANKEAEALLVGMNEGAGERADISWDQFENFLDEKIALVDDKVNSRRMRGMANKTIGVMAGTFLGYWGASRVAEMMERKQTIGGIFKDSYEKLRGMVGVNDEAVDGINKIAAMDTAGGAANKAASSFELVVDKGSSIEGELIEHIKEHHGGQFKNPGAAAHRMFRDYMSDYIESHRDELAANGKLAEYQEMLRSGKVNIQPGAKIIFDESKMCIQSIEGDIKLLHGVDHMDVPDAPVPLEEGNETVIGNEPSLIDPGENVTERLQTLEGHELDQHGSAAERIAYDQERVGRLNELHREAADARLNAADGVEEIRTAEELGKIQKELAEVKGRLADAFGTKDLEAAHTIRALRMGIAGGMNTPLNEMPMEELLSPEIFNKLPIDAQSKLVLLNGPKVPGYLADFARQMRESGGFGASDSAAAHILEKTPFKPGDTFGAWTKRVGVVTQVFGEKLAANQ